VKDGQVICPYCYAPQRRATPLMHRPIAVAALLLLLAAIAVTIRLLIR
jgi:hypothetical protein